MGEYRKNGNNSTTIWDYKTDVLIIGSGFAGLSAAIGAYNAGSKVIILEKMPNIGGNSIIAGGGINAVDPERQNNQGIDDSHDLHFKHTFEGGNRLGEPVKIRHMVENALEVIKWLEDFGVKFPEKVVRGYGAMWQRTHYPPKYKNYKKGKAIINALFEQVKKSNIKVFTKHKVVELIRENYLKGKLLGVKVKKGGDIYKFKANKGIVLASGGFAANLQEVSKHDRRLKVSTSTTNNPAVTGEVIRVAQDIGASTIHMSYIQCVPLKVSSSHKAMFYSIGSKETNNYPISYNIFVNKFGNRFVGEDSRRDKITLKATEQTLFNPSTVIGDEGNYVTANSVKKLEDKLGTIPKGNLEKTINEYNTFCIKKEDKNFNKSSETLIPLNPPFSAKTMAQARHYTMGGLRTKGLKGKVIDRKGKIIPNLYAAGEIAGGIHGANRLGHNSTLECLLFGREVGNQFSE